MCFPRDSLEHACDQEGRVLSACTCELSLATPLPHPRRLAFPALTPWLRIPPASRLPFPSPTQGCAESAGRMPCASWAAWSLLEVRETGG